MDIRSVADIVRAHSAERPDAIALSLGDRKVTWRELYERARPVATGLRSAGVGPQDRVAFLDKNGIEHFEHHDYDRGVAVHADDDPDAPSTDADVAVQLYSSGTTGRPKGVMISNDNLIGLLPIGADVWGMSAESVVLVAMPLYHIGGSGCTGDDVDAVDTPGDILVRGPQATREAIDEAGWFHSGDVGYPDADFTAALPRNPSGKVLEKDLRAPYWEDRERQVN